MTTILVTTSRGLDSLLEEEIKTLLPHVSTRTTPGCVTFDGELKDAYTLCLWSRLANRVLWVLSQGKVNDAKHLYEETYAVNWDEHFTCDDSFVVQFNGTNRAINHTQFGAQKTKDAIVDQFADRIGERPTVDRAAPDITVFARVRREHLDIGIDLTGSSLHQRHYRLEQGDAPLKEHVASAVLMRSGWSNNKSQPLIDPMCGSGTIAIEAALMASNIAPGLQRKRWGFNAWKEHDAACWDTLCNQARESHVTPTCMIYASDNDPNMIAKAKRNADNANVFDCIQFANGDVTTLIPPIKTPGYLVSNPPYGERLNELSQLVPLFTSWGKQLKSAWADWRISLLSSNRDLLRTLKLRAVKEYSLMNGKLECKLANYVLDESNLQQLSSDTDHAFSNRIKKNLKKLKPWINKQNTNCYRIYDADLPEYNVAVDKYADYVVVQEYAAPKTIDENKAKRRLQDVMLHLPAALNMPNDKIILKVREQQKGKQQYEKMNQTQRRIAVHENGAQFLVNLWDYLDTGLFLDHRETRQIVHKMAKNKHVLNLFAYTGSVSVMAAIGGARSVTTVDMSNTYIQWAKDNFAQNKISGAHAFIQADCTAWLATHSNKYGLIFIDPPSFSNSKRMEGTWDVQRDHMDLITAAEKCLQTGGDILFSNNKRGFKLNESALNDIGLCAENITPKTIPEDFKRHSKIHQCWIIRHAS